jgi:RNA polymerase sigma factor (sigma-70 family)
MRPGADRYTPDDTADRPTSSAGSGFAEAYRVHRPGLVKPAAFIVGDQATGEDVGQDSPSPPLSAEESVLLSGDRQQVLAALARLSRRRREVLVLRFYVGLPEAEIAATLGISAGTVKSTAARGLAALARALRETR